MMVEEGREEQEQASAGVLSRLGCCCPALVLMAPRATGSCAAIPSLHLRLRKKGEKKRKGKRTPVSVD